MKTPQTFNLKFRSCEAERFLLPLSLPREMLTYFTGVSGKRKNLFSVLSVLCGEKNQLEVRCFLLRAGLDVHF